MAEKAGWQGLVMTAHRVMNAGTQLTFSFDSLPAPSPWTWCCPHRGWINEPNYPNLETPSCTCPESCLLDDTDSRQLTVLTTIQYMKQCHWPKQVDTDFTTPEIINSPWISPNKRILYEPAGPQGIGSSTTCTLPYSIILVCFLLINSHRHRFYSSIRLCLSLHACF